MRSGVDIKDVIEASQDFKSVNKLEKNRKMMEYMLGTIDQYVDDPRRQPSNRNMNFFRRYMVLMCFIFGKFLGNYLVILYLFVKVLYILNCVGQLFLISILLGRNYYIYGMSIFRDIIMGKGYADSEYFPRVTMCKFQVRELGLKNFSHEYNVQCVLPINLFNQQIFTFLWFWYLILLVINTCALFIWIYRFVPRNQYNYAIRRVKLLKIRLLENSKVPKESGRSSGKTFKSNMKSRIENEKISSNFSLTDNYDDEFVYTKRYNLTNQRSSFAVPSDSNNIHSIFPNIPTNFHYEVQSMQRTRQRLASTASQININNSSGAGSSTNHDQINRDFSIINEYETYMAASSFNIKNYKAFVHDYLEADGNYLKKNLNLI